MKITFDPETDTLTLVLREGQIAESDEEKPGIIIDYDDLGEIVGIEILDASTRVTDPSRIEFTAAAT